MAEHTPWGEVTEVVLLYIGLHGLNVVAIVGQVIIIWDGHCNPSTFLIGGLKARTPLVSCRPMYSAGGNAALPALGFPIRASTDQWLFNAYPWLIAVVHALLRL